MTTTEFTIKGSSGNLACKLITPVEAPEHVVIFMHGFGADMSCLDWYGPITERLSEAEIASLYFDFDGHGKSDGKFENMTPDKELQDAVEVLGWAVSQKGMRGITLLGHSFGGLVAAMTAGRINVPCVSQAVLMAPAASMRDSCLRGNLWGTIFDPWHPPATILLKTEDGDFTVGREFVENFLFLPIYETAAKYKGKTLIVQGLQDTGVPFTYAERFHEVMEGSELHLIPGADHLFTNLVEPISKLIADWIIHQTQAGA
ncbi:MAG: alpha/beta hydrolase [Burkholderiales bacterium]|nr:alpha/beta hydrolase [Burkholderiales bacterium]